MSTIVDATADLDAAVTAAVAALREGKVVSLPTDTVYGVAADAFNPIGTTAVFAAKRRDRSAPLPVLVRSPKQLLGLVTTVPEAANRLMAAYWPGPLTIVVRSEPHLAWDLGDNQGTVAVRMPFDDVTLAVIREVGPLAVTSANLAGNPAATSAALARSQLGDAVAVYVDGGRRADTTPSTIVDLTRAEPTILRSGPLDDDEVLAVATGALDAHAVTPFDPPDHGGPASAAAAPAAPAAPAPGDPGESDDAAPDAHADAGAGAGRGVGADRGKTEDAADTADVDVPGRDSSGSGPASRHVARDHRASR